MCVSRRGTRLAAAALIALAALSGCVPFELKQILDGPKGKGISISPNSTIVAAGGTVTFVGDGGVPPYVYSIASGSGGSLNSSTGVFTAFGVASTAVVRVTDKTGRGADATVTIQVAGVALLASPGALSLAVGGTVTFSAIGGTGPYTWSLLTNNSGSPSVGATGTSWLYTAGPTPLADVVQLKDATNTIVTVNVSVTVLSSAVDYAIPLTNFSTIVGIAGTVIPAGNTNTFTIHNNGQAGTQPITWKVYLSANATIDGGDVLVASGTTPAVGTHADSVVDIGGTPYPSGPVGAGFLIAQVSAADETNQANNASGASAFTLTPKLVDYVVDSVAQTSGTGTGAAMQGTMTLHNIGSANGTAPVNWTVYASHDAVLDPSDYTVAFGTASPLNATTIGAPFTFNGYWPSTTGPWYLIAVVSAADDVGPGNNATPSAATTTLSGPPPANADYTVINLTNAGSTTAGDPFSGTFAIQNSPAGGGSLPIFWTAYLSSDSTLQIGTDQVIDSGSLPTGLAAGAASSTITFNGTWPSTPGSWYLIVAVSASDDLVPGNNVSAVGAIATLPQNINYTVWSLGAPNGTAGAALSGTLTIRNVGGHNGAQFVPYAVYLSSDTFLNFGTDQLIATGSIPAPGLASSTTSASLPFAGTWPASNVPKTWYLIATVGAGDDVDATNNVVASSGIAVAPPDINYAPTAYTNVSGTTGGAPFSGKFQIVNTGTVTGSSNVAWTVYLSPDATLDITDRTAATGTGVAGSGDIAVNGTWPAGTATWNVFVKISAPDDVSSANDISGPIPVSVTGTNPVYTIAAVSVPAGSTTGQPVSGNFKIHNGGTAGGASNVTWQVYASLGDAVYNAGDVLIDSNTIGGGVSMGGDSPQQNYAGTWPSTPGTWYIVVRASAADAPAVPDAASGAVAVANPPAPDYTISFDPNIPWTGIVGTQMNLTGTTQVTINNISANIGHATVNWAVYLSTDDVLDAGDTVVKTGSFGPLAGSGSQTVNFTNAWPAAPGRIYWLIATVSAADDNNPTNNVVLAPHTVATGDFRYVEGAEDNSGTGPTVNATKTSATGASLGPSMAVVIEGTMDAYVGVNSQYDTYKFATLTGVNQLNMRAMWATGFDDVDLFLWDAGGSTNLPSQEVGINSEPGNNFFQVTSVTPRTCYIGANFYLDANTSGSAGKRYFIFVQGVP